MKARRRAASLLEVLGVFVAAQIIVSLLIRVFSLRVANPLQNFTVDITNSELITATYQVFVLLVLQYAGWFLLIIPINWWHRRSGPAAYGLSRAGRSWMTLLLAGLATAALSQWPTLSVELFSHFHPIGETVPWRQAFFDTSWRRWEFWLFSAVASWAFVPLVEELFFRGYCQRRLAEDWGDGAAIVGSACLFIFAHGQYLTLNAYNAAMVVSLLAIAIGQGVVFAWTRSLIPPIVAHTVINIPMTPLWQGVILTAFVIGVALAWRPGMAVVRQVFSGTRVVSCVALAIVGIAYAVMAARVSHLEFAAAVMVVSAVALEAVERRKDAAALASAA